MRILLHCFINLISVTAAVAFDGRDLEIVGQRELRIDEGESITIALSDLTVEADPDLNYPNGFYLDIDDDDHYDVNGNTITPDKEFSGKLKVKLRITNGEEKSNKYTLEIRVGKNGNDNDNEDDDDEDEDDDEKKDKDDEDNGNGNGGNGNGGNGNSNQRPQIINQISVNINQSESFKIGLSHLVVVDNDDEYPDDFTLIVADGDNYYLSGSTVNPAQNFTGNLQVPVKVNDGRDDSNTFIFVIVVSPQEIANAKPVITAQSTLTTFKDQTLEIRLADISVTDSDDDYPSGFALKIAEGDNYQVNGTSVTPANGFVGTLSIPIRVHDGKDNSDFFALKVSVIEQGTLQIVGQSAVIIKEDSTFDVKRTHLKVNDPSGKYPSGFKLTILPGDHYTVDQGQVVPEKDFNGHLIVGITVSNEDVTSSIFEFLIVVEPVNDPPVFKTFSREVSLHESGPEAFIASEVEVADIDHVNLKYAEIQIDSADGSGILTVTNTEHIKGVFDQVNGILVLIGDAPLEEYNEIFHSISYSATDSIKSNTKLIFRLNDGESFSNDYEKILVPGASGFDIAIPTAFTPNDDNANDTWEIDFAYGLNENTTVSVKVYNKRGVLLFESDNLENTWDGKLNGEFLPSDTYFYTMEIIAFNRIERRKGVVNILR